MAQTKYRYIYSISRNLAIIRYASGYDDDEDEVDDDDECKLSG